MADENNNGSKSGSDNKKKRPNNRRRYNNRNRNKNKSSNTGEVKASSANNPHQKNADGNKKKRPNNNNKKRRYNNRRRKNGPKLTGEDYIAAKYLNLLEQHLNARKKYFDNFKRVDKHIEVKLEKNFVESQKALLGFKDRLNEKDKKIYEERYENLKLDLTYSKNHKISPTEHLEIQINTDDIIDPHLLQTQISSNFKEDTEESVGSLDDYKAYKGITD